MENKKKRFSELRAELVRNDYSQAELAFDIHRSVPYFNLRMNGHKEWDLEDVYRIMCCLELPLEKMATYFPRGGVSA